MMRPRIPLGEFQIRRTALILAIVWTLAVIFALASLGRRMRPVNRGTSDDFWASAAFVSIRGGHVSGDQALFEGDQAYYSPATMDGQWLYSISRKEALEDWPLVIHAWDARAAAHIPDDDLVPEYLKWKVLPLAEQTPESMMRHLNAGRDTRMDILYPHQPGQASFNDMKLEWLKREIGRSKLYWLNFVFEFLLLSGLGWLTAWPFIRKCSTLRALLHFLTVPFLFLLPAWFGYSPFMISGVGPAGGIVYPWLLVYTRPMQFDFAWERRVLSHMPPLLDPINQNPAMSWRDVASWKIPTVSVPGPLEALLAGLALCGLCLFVRMIVRHLREARLRRPGFEVLPPIPSNTTPESAPPAPAPR